MVNGFPPRSAEKLIFIVIAASAAAASVSDMELLPVIKHPSMIFFSLKAAH